MDEILFDYFTIDNNSGKKCTEKWLSKHNKILYDSIFIWSKENDLEEIEFKRKVYHFINKNTIIPKCLNCEKSVTYQDVKQGYSKYCSIECVKSSNLVYEKWIDTWKKNNSNNNFILKRKNTCLKKYKNEKYNNREKTKKTCLDKYGVENTFQNDEIKEKRKNTLYDRYGDEKFNNKDKTRLTRIKNGTQINDENFESYQEYKKIVVNKTITIYRNNIDEINPSKLKRGKKYYHIDHLYSIKQGFLNNISIEIITHPCNLSMIWYLDNITKQDKCNITMDVLIEKIKNYDNPNIIKNSKLNELYKKENILKTIYF